MSVEARIASLLGSWTGIDLPRVSMRPLRAFIAERCRILGLPSEASYLSVLGGPDSAEFQRLVNAVTVTYTWFYRDLEQIETLRAILGSSGRRPFRVWVPGCASGEDAYTVALVAKELGVSARVLGTDVNSSAIAKARSGRYGEWSVRDVPPAARQWFGRDPGFGFSLDSAVRSTVRLEVHNLLSPPPVPDGGGAWDLILCRNVLMYFEKRRAKATVQVLASSLDERGYLILGASDVMVEAPAALAVEYVRGRVTFRKAGAGAAPFGLGLQGPAVGSARIEATPVAGDAVPSVSLEDPEPQKVPTTAVSLLDSAHVHLASGRLDLAERAYAMACETEPFAPEPRLYAGIARYLAGDLSGAFESFRACLLLDARCWPASYYLGLCYENMGLAGDACREYDRAACESAREPDTEADPHSPLFGFRRDLAWLARQRGTPRRAS